MTGRLSLDRIVFDGKERVIFESGKMRAVAFAFDGGVAAVRLENARGHVVMLPWQGQQVWDVVFDGRRLTMQSIFPQPVASRSIFDCYGSFLYHCGALRVGNPGPQDNHPMHGELPAAPYRAAWVDFGEDAEGPWIGVSGEYRYARAFGDVYLAVPQVKVHEGGTLLDVTMKVENLAHAPMDLMYMCHVNFLPAANGEIVQAAGWDPKDMAVRLSIPPHVHPTPKFRAFLESLAKDPGATRVLRPEDEYNPEVVFYIRNMKRDARGMTHVMQRHTDGTADYVGWDPSVMDHVVRWIVVHADQKVLGMALPATCDPEGYTAEKQKGNVRTLGPLGTATFSVRTGALDAAAARAMEASIRAL
jgi:hypothetical protein